MGGSLGLGLGGLWYSIDMIFMAHSESTLPVDTRVELRHQVLDRSRDGGSCQRHVEL